MISLKSNVRMAALATCSVLLLPAQSFEVASIKPNASNDHRVSIAMQPGGRFVATGIPLRLLIGQAYNVRDFQITGGPDWVNNEAYDINAKGEPGAGDRIAPDQLRAMLKNLLAERFGLKVKEETKEMPVYALVVGKNGSKLTPAATTEGAGPGQIRMGRGQINAKGMPIEMLTRTLSQNLGRHVIDKTDLKGRFDIELQWTPEPGQAFGPFGGGAPPPPGAGAPAESTGPTIFTAVQEQLGLRLESTKGPVPMLVIESISKPTEN